VALGISYQAATDDGLPEHPGPRESHSSRAEFRQDNQRGIGWQEADGDGLKKLALLEVPGELRARDREQSY
jgi:hypothetical protein